MTVPVTISEPVVGNDMSICGLFVLVFQAARLHGPCGIWHQAAANSGHIPTSERRKQDEKTNRTVSSPNPHLKHTKTGT
jgi:hypothetical protein